MLLQPRTLQMFVASAVLSGKDGLPKSRSGCAEDSAHYSWRRRAVSLVAILLPRETAE